MSGATDYPISRKHDWTLFLVHIKIFLLSLLMTNYSIKSWRRRPTTWYPWLCTQNSFGSLFAICVV